MKDLPRQNLQPRHDGHSVKVTKGTLNSNRNWQALVKLLTKQLVGRFSGEDALVVKPYKRVRSSTAGGWDGVESVEKLRRDNAPDLVPIPMAI